MCSAFAQQAGVGVVVPHDMALDRELWRWTPPDVSLFLTRTPHHPHEVTLEMVAAISDVDLVAASASDLLATGCDVVAYACASGSFLRGVAGERALVDAMCRAGAPAAVTTSGALLAATAHLGVRRLAVATPYHPSLTTRLDDFLAEAGLDLVGSAHLGLTSDICKVDLATTADLVRTADDAAAEAIFISCTNLPTYDLVADLEAELGKPVVTANQATVWAALRAIGRTPVGPGQRLCEG
jgi:maleate isomerase